MDLSAGSSWSATCTAAVVAWRSRIAFEPADPEDPTLSVDGLDDFLPDKGDRGDPTLAVSNLQEFFTPEPVARTPPAALEPPVVAAPAREITARDNDDIRHPRDNDEIRRTDVPRLVARNNSTSVVDRPQETFAPEFAAPIRRFVEERGTPTVKRV